MRTARVSMVAGLTLTFLSLSNAEYRIVGGNPVPDGEFEAVGELPECTATLITDQHVLTAGHCICENENPGEPRNCDSRSTFTFSNVFPVDSPSTPADGSQIRQDVTIEGNVREHPEYVAVGWLSHDFALLTLDVPASDKVLNVEPIRVEYPERKPEVGDRLTLVGFGRTGNDCLSPPAGKRQIQLAINEVSSGNVTLRLGQPGMASCPGDSGGPGINSTGKIVGVASSGPNDNDANYDPTYLAYDWIEQQVTVAVSNTSLDFGATAQGDIRSRTLTFKNSSEFPVAVRVQSNQTPPISGFFWSGLDTTLSPGTSRTFVVEFLPRAEGRFRQTLQIQRTPGWPAKVQLKGRGLPSQFEPD